jgi:diguanylate cyclase (GGDEF)-like protein/PAS domain S-box-containing protein
MKRSTSQTPQVVFFLIALGLFTLSVLAMAAYRGVVSSQINQDAIIAGRLRSYALLIYIDKKESSTLTNRRQQLTTMSKDIQILLAKYPVSSDELIMVWRQFYSDVQTQRLNLNNTQNMVQVADHFLDEISSHARSESRNGYVMLICGALGLLLLLARGFILLRELHKAESNLRNSERRFSILAEASIDGIAISENGIIEDANTQFCQLLGYEPAEVLGHHLTEFAQEQDVERSNEIIRNNREVSYEVTCVRKDKSTFPVEITARTLQFPQRTMRLTVARDITAQKKLEKEWQEANKSLAVSNERWRALATVDCLTGAHTRRALHLTMIREIRRASYSGLPFSVMLLDLDRFKQYNDTFGHLAGDEVLRRVVEVLRAALRDVDVVARYGGDEFIIILVDTGALEANAVARRCYQAIKNETTFKRDMIASIGVLTCFIDSEASVNKEFCIELVEGILLCADKALYQAKRKTEEHIHVADNLRVNKGFVVTKPSITTPTAIKSVEDDIVDDIMSDLAV